MENKEPETIPQAQQEPEQVSEQIPQQLPDQVAQKQETTTESTSAPETSKMMRAVMLDKWGGELTIQNVPIPKPKSGQVLIKVEAAPINPSDILFYNGKYLTPLQPPVQMGYEGSGTVIESGGGLLAWNLKGDRVSLVAGAAGPGTWAEYVVADAKQCITLDKDTSFEQGACFFVNPLTALAFEDIVVSGKYKAVIHTAAASQLGRMFVRLMAKKKIPLINIVRKEEQREILKGLGAEIILNSSDENFEQTLKETAEKYNATICFDAVGGDLTWKITQNMPKSSIVYVYGSLAQDGPTAINAGHLLMSNKTIKGFMVTDWLQEKNIVTVLRTMRRIKSELKADFKTELNKEFSLDQVKEAMDYYKDNMSKGKNLIKPWLK